jgi:hypothetical protein
VSRFALGYGDGVVIALTPELPAWITLDIRLNGDATLASTFAARRGINPSPRFARLPYRGVAGAIAGATFDFVRGFLFHSGGYWSGERSERHNLWYKRRTGAPWNRNVQCRRIS